MFKELVTDIPAHGNLGSWADQGVLLLNATLTVEDGKANSHVKFAWDKFTNLTVYRRDHSKGLCKL
jgi:uracil-DNA glycosylase